MRRRGNGGVWLVMLGAASLLAACPSPAPHPIAVDQSGAELDYCADYCARSVDTGLPSGVACECPPEGSE